MWPCRIAKGGHPEGAIRRWRERSGYRHLAPDWRRGQAVLRRARASICQIQGLPLSPSRHIRAHTRKDRSPASPLRKPPSTRRKTTGKSLGPLTRRASMNPDFDMTPPTIQWSRLRPRIQEDWLRTHASAMSACPTIPAEKTRPRKHNPPAGYRQLTALTRDPNEDTAAIARADLTA